MGGVFWKAGAALAVLLGGATGALAQDDAALKPVMGCVALHESVHFVRKKLELPPLEGHAELRALWQAHVAAHKGQADDFALTEIYTAATRDYWPLVLAAETARKAGQSAPEEPAYAAALANCVALDAALPKPGGAP